jgi:hypothetical protein
MAHYKIYSEICLNRTLNKLNIRFSPNIVNFSEFDLPKPNTCLFQTKCLVWKGFDLDRFHCLWIVKHTPPPSFFLILPRSKIKHSIIVYRLVMWTVYIIHIQVTQDIYMCCFHMCHIWVWILSCFQHYFLYIYCRMLNLEYPVKTFNLLKVNDKRYQIDLYRMNLDMGQNRTRNLRWR